MSDAFESEVMDDLFYDSAEGPARPRYGDEFEELDELEDEFEGFEDEFEEYDALEDYGDEMGAFDSMEDAVADALDAEDTDEFFRRIAGAARGSATPRGVPRRSSAGSPAAFPASPVSFRCLRRRRSAVSPVPWDACCRPMSWMPWMR